MGLLPMLEIDNRRRSNNVSLPVSSSQVAATAVVVDEVVRSSAQTVELCESLA